VSVKYPNAKFSFGYRADFFFGAMDTGIDARRQKTSASTARSPRSRSVLGIGEHGR